MYQWEYCTLIYDGYSIRYILYQNGNVYYIERTYQDQLWQWCIYTLALIKWESIGNTPLAASGIQCHYRRVHNNSNSTFAFP